MLIANSHPDLPEHQVADHGDYFPNFADTVRELFFPQYIQHYLRQDKIALAEQNRFNLFSFLLVCCHC